MPASAATRPATGLVLEVHEDPYIMRGNEGYLEPGMVFTVEPGLYDDTALRRAHRGRRGGN